MAVGDTDMKFIIEVTEERSPSWVLGSRYRTLITTRIPGYYRNGDAALRRGDRIREGFEKLNKKTRVFVLPYYPKHPSTGHYAD